MHLRALRFALVLTAAAPRALWGQGIATVRGTVTNESGRPLEHALVTLDPDAGSRQVRTNREGGFSFVGVPQGAHTVRVTWVGFSPETRQIEVGSSGDVTVDVVLRRLTYLDTVAVVAKRTGLYGSVISKDSLLPVPGARIEIIGARKADSTNSSGTFNFPELKPGTYMVRVKHPFFESRNFNVTVPVGGGTELDAVVERGRVSRDQHMEMLYREMDSRLTFRGANTAFITREELKGKEKVNLVEALKFAPEYAKKALFISTDVCLFVDGMKRPNAMIQDFAVEDIESIELYAAPLGLQRQNWERATRQADPTGSLRNRWVLDKEIRRRDECGLPPPPHMQRSGWAELKVMYALIWLKK
jgi:hypothetical protein